MWPETNSSAVVDGQLRQWKLPLPYFFGGLALMLGLVCLVLVILACSYKMSRVEQSDDGKADGKTEEMRPEMEPKIVVIMAGDETPTFLAKPVAPSVRHHNQPAS